MFNDLCSLVGLPFITHFVTLESEHDFVDVETVPDTGCHCVRVTKSKDTWSLNSKHRGKCYWICLLDLLRWSMLLQILREGVTEVFTLLFMPFV